jgi:hypothetical protein
MKEYQKTKIYGVDHDADGNRKLKTDGSLATYITSENAFNADVKKSTEAKEPLPEALATGTFGYKAAETVDEAITLCGGSGVGEYENIDVFLGVFNYAASLRQDNEANRLLTNESYVQADETVDVSYAVAEKVERAKMTPEEKAVKMLAAGGIRISPEQLRAALAQIKASGASA